MTDSETAAALEYRRQWLGRLHVEYRNICFRHQLVMRAPSFEITEGKTRLGAWLPADRTIQLAAVLIENYSWDAVISILRHEMAHQYVHEVMGRGDEMPHGPAFFDACELLGVPDRFRPATGDTPRVFVDSDPAASSENSRRLQRVGKLFALAQSANIHEAETAMRKANSLIRRYNLERLNQAEPASYAYSIINTGRRRKQIIQRQLAALLMDFFFVDVIYSELYDARACETFKTIELLGTRANVAFARYVHEFLAERVEYLWQSYKKQAGAPGRKRQSYILGLLNGFREKLELDEQEAVAAQSNAGNTTAEASGRTTSALVVAGDSGLGRFIANRFPRLRKVRYRSNGVSCAAAYSKGRKEGARITIHKPLRQHQGNRGRLLA